MDVRSLHETHFALAGNYAYSLTYPWSYVYARPVEALYLEMMPNDGLLPTMLVSSPPTICSRRPVEQKGKRQVELLWNILRFSGGWRSCSYFT